MKKCPKCQELNGESANECYNCHEPFPIEPKVEKRICPKCGAVYNQTVVVCNHCQTQLTSFTPELLSSTGSTSKFMEPEKKTWAYVLTVLMPIIGLILGFIFISRGEDEEGKSLLTLSVVLTIAYGVLYFLLSSCAVRNAIGG